MFITLLIWFVQLARPASLSRFEIKKTIETSMGKQTTIYSGDADKVIAARQQSAERNDSNNNNNLKQEINITSANDVDINMQEKQRISAHVEKEYDVEKQVEEMDLNKSSTISLSTSSPAFIAANLPSRLNSSSCSGVQVEYVSCAFTSIL